MTTRYKALRQSSIPTPLFVGKYKLVNNSRLVSIEGNYQFLIAARKQPKKGKASKFLLRIGSNGQRSYISSLYPINDGYRLDYKGLSYRLKLQCEPKSDVYHYDLVSYKETFGHE